MSIINKMKMLNISKRGRDVVKLDCLTTDTDSASVSGGTMADGKCATPCVLLIKARYTAYNDVHDQHVIITNAHHMSMDAMSKLVNPTAGLLWYI